MKTDRPTAERPAELINYADGVDGLVQLGICGGEKIVSQV